MTQQTAVTRQTSAARSHLFGSNTLHLVPVEHLRNLVATHPAAVGVEWSNHVWDPFLPVLLVNTGFTFGKQPVLAERYAHALVCVLGFYMECYDCSVCLRDQCALMGLFFTIVVP